MAKLTDTKIIAAVQRIDELRDLDWKAKMDAEDGAMEELHELTKDINGVVPGQLVSWQVADGSALYIILTAGKRTCTLHHLAIYDCYHSPAVDAKGKCLTSLLEEKVAMEELYAKMFEN